MIVFHSDHGEMLGDHGIYTKDAFFYDGAVRVPLIVSWPGRIAAGQTVSGLVELADIAPTITEACGLPRRPDMQARSLWPALCDASSWLGREDVVCEFYGANPKRSADPNPRFATMLRTSTRKLVRYHGRTEGELYDLENDPGEHRNRWSDPTWAHERARLTERLADRIAWFADPQPERVGVF
jgi:arylsulfatase A-like enzyme